MRHKKLLQNNYTTYLCVSFFNKDEIFYSDSKLAIFIVTWLCNIGFRLRFMVFNTTFNHISVISWRSVLLVEETGVPRENHRPAVSHWQTSSHNGCIEYTSPWVGFELTTLVVIGTDCLGSCKSNYHTTTTALCNICILHPIGEFWVCYFTNISVIKISMTFNNYYQ